MSLWSLWVSQCVMKSQIKLWQYTMQEIKQKALLKQCGNAPADLLEKSSSYQKTSYQKMGHPFTWRSKLELMKNNLIKGTNWRTINWWPWLCGKRGYIWEKMKRWNLICFASIHHIGTLYVLSSNTSGKRQKYMIELDVFRDLNLAGENLRNKHMDYWTQSETNW